MATVLPPWLQTQLSSLLAQRGHAVLLNGAAGLGQYPLALALAKAWLCDHPDPAQGACGQCTACHAVAVHTHPDLCVLMPDTTALAWGWPLDPKTQDKIDRKETKPGKWIRVDAARAAVAFTQLTRSRGRNQVVLVYPAERLNTESANALLKTLEEPTGEVRFVLATEAIHQVPPTVRSRCLLHRMVWPEATLARSWLASQPLEVSPDAWDVWWRACGGKPDAALALAQTGLPAQAWDKLPKALAQADWGGLKDWSAAQQLEVLQKLCHDLLVAGQGAEPRFFLKHALPTGLDPARLVAWQIALQKAAETVEHPYHQHLLQDAWLIQAQQALRPQTASTRDPHAIH